MRLSAGSVSPWLYQARSSPRTCVTDTGMVDLDADLMGLWRRNLDILHRQRLTGAPGNGGLFMTLALSVRFLLLRDRKSLLTLQVMVWDCQYAVLRSRTGTDLPFQQC